MHRKKHRRSKNEALHPKDIEIRTNEEDEVSDTANSVAFHNSMAHHIDARILSEMRQ
jgi:hypothetical protein